MALHSIMSMVRYSNIEMVCAVYFSNSVTFNTNSTSLFFGGHTCPFWGATGTPVLEIQ